MVILSVNWMNVFIVTIVGFVIVFVVLAMLISLLHLFGWVVNRRQNEKDMPEEVMSVVSAKESAAIAMALYLCNDRVHDEESDVITIRNINIRYSPWSSKIYGIQ